MKKLILIFLVLSACVDHELKPAGPPPEASAFICQIPRHWTLASNYVIHPLPFQHQRGLTYTSSTYAGKGMPSNNIYYKGNKHRYNHYSGVFRSFMLWQSNFTTRSIVDIRYNCLS